MIRAQALAVADWLSTHGYDASVSFDAPATVGGDVQYRVTAHVKTGDTSSHIARLRQLADEVERRGLLLTLSGVLTVDDPTP